MLRRLRKQIIYGFFYLTVLIAAASIVYIYLIKPEPSCFDGIKNQDEVGIDCGGVCVKACLPAGLKPIELAEPILILRPDESHISLLIKVSNPNSINAARSFSYKVSLNDETGKSFWNFDGSSFVYAGEVKYVLIPNSPVEKNKSAKSVDFKIDKANWVNSSEFTGPPQISVQGVHTTDQAKSLLVDGVVVNEDTSIFSSVTIIALFKGGFGQIGGASQTEINNLTLNEARKFSILHPYIPNADLSGTKIFVYASRP